MCDDKWESVENDIAHEMHADDLEKRIASLEAELDRRNVSLAEIEVQWHKRRMNLEEENKRLEALLEISWGETNILEAERDRLRELARAVVCNPYQCPSTSEPDSEPIYIVERLPFDTLAAALPKETHDASTYHKSQEKKS